MRDVIVVGGGLFGCIASEALRRSGRDVLQIDNLENRAGSRAAACLMKPSWLNKIPKADLNRSFQLLDDLYGLRTVNLMAGPVSVSAFWVPPDTVLAPDIVRITTVKSVDSGRVELLSGEVLEARQVIVAAGVWTSKLIEGIDVVGKVGASLRLNQPPVDNRIHVWAPYRQLVRFGQEGFNWAGDGTAIIEKNWTGQRLIDTSKRIADYAGAGETRTGIRPYVKTTSPAVLKEVKPGLWALTGGGKNGTAAAGWAAAELLERL